MKEKTSKAMDSVILEEVAQGKELSIRNNEDITDAEIIEDDDKFWAEENHPNFIESNTSEIMKILQMLKLLKMMISFGQKKITQTLLNLIPQQFRLRN